MEKLLETLQQQWKQIKDDVDEWNEKITRDERFVDDQSKDEDELVGEGETILDRKLMMKSRFDMFVRKSKEIENVSQRIQQEIKWLMNEIERMNESLVGEINGMIQTIKTIKTRKLNKEIEQMNQLMIQTCRQLPSIPMNRMVKMIITQ